MRNRVQDKESARKDGVMQEYIEAAMKMNATYGEIERKASLRKSSIFNEIVGWLDSESRRVADTDKVEVPKGGLFSNDVTVQNDEKTTNPTRKRKVTFDINEFAPIELTQDEILTEMGANLYEQYSVLNRAIKDGTIKPSEADKHIKGIKNEASKLGYEEMVAVAKELGFVSRVSETKSLGPLKKRVYSKEGPRNFVDLTQESDDEKSIGK